MMETLLIQRKDMVLEDVTELCVGAILVLHIHVVTFSS